MSENQPETVKPEEPLKKVDDSFHLLAVPEYGHAKEHFYLTEETLAKLIQSYLSDIQYAKLYVFHGKRIEVPEPAISVKVELPSSPLVVKLPMPPRPPAGAIPRDATPPAAIGHLPTA